MSLGLSGQPRMVHCWDLRLVSLINSQRASKLDFLKPRPQNLFLTTSSSRKAMNRKMTRNWCSDVLTRDIWPGDWRPQEAIDWTPGVAMNLLAVALNPGWIVLSTGEWIL